MGGHEGSASPGFPTEDEVALSDWGCHSCHVLQPQFLQLWKEIASVQYCTPKIRAIGLD